MKKERNPQELPKLGIHDVSEHECDQCSLDAHLLASFEVGSKEGEEPGYSGCYELCFQLKNEREIPVLIQPEELVFYPGMMDTTTRRMSIGQNWEEVHEFLMYGQEEKTCKINYSLDKAGPDQDYTLIVPFRDDRGTAYRQKFVIGIRPSETNPGEETVDYILSDDPEWL